MNILHVFDQAFEGIDIKTIDYIYITVDVHDTIFKGHSKDFIWLGKSKECLQYISKIPLFKLVIWTGTFTSELHEIVTELNKNDIKYIGINENDHYRNVKNKLYTNILIDDRAGFEPDDWEKILNYLENKFDKSELSINGTILEPKDYSEV